MLVDDDHQFFPGKENFIFFAAFIAFFAIFAGRMGLMNTLNTLMNTAYSLLIDTVFYLMTTNSFRET